MLPPTRLLAAATCAAALLAVPAAQAADHTVAPVSYPGVQHLHYRYGPKTITQFPQGFGYHYGPKDPWVLNYMLHNLVTTPARVYLTWDVDFVPDAAAAASGIKEVKPLWLDTGNGNYPVWDAQRGWGKNG